MLLVKIFFSQKHYQCEAILINSFHFLSKRKQFQICIHVSKFYTKINVSDQKDEQLYMNWPCMQSYLTLDEIKISLFNAFSSKLNLIPLCSTDEEFCFLK